MLRAILRKELQFHLAGFPLRVGMLLTLVLAASITLIAARDYNLRLQDYRDRIAAHTRALREETVYSFLQPVVVRPPEPLSILDQGLDAHLGGEVAIHLFAIPAEATGGYRGNELLGTSPAADLTAIVIIVLGLLSLLLAHDAVQAERNDWTLLAFRACGIRRGTLLTGKVLGGLLALALPLGGALLVSLAILLVQLESELSSDQWLRIAGLAVAYVSYLSLMFLLGMLVSLSVRSRSRALEVTVVVWLAAVSVLPGAARTLVGNLGSPQEARLTAARRAAALLAERDRRLEEERRRDPLRAMFSGDYASSFATGQNRAVRYRYGSAAYYEALRAYYRTEVTTGMRYAEIIFVERQRSEERLRRAEWLHTAAAMISPAALLDDLSEELAGTSTGEYDRFLTACRSYRLALIRYLERKNAFDSWRWFTDDSPERLQPWPRFLGLSPNEVEPGEARQLFDRFSDPEVASRVRVEQIRFERDPARRLPIDDLPRFVVQRASFLACSRRGAPEALGLFVLNGLAWMGVAACFRRWTPG
jgi:hypothetical protein